jgi:hypothetical protein
MTREEFMDLLNRTCLVGVWSLHAEAARAEMQNTYDAQAARIAELEEMLRVAVVGAQDMQADRDKYRECCDARVGRIAELEAALAAAQCAYDSAIIQELKRQSETGRGPLTMVPTGTLDLLIEDACEEQTAVLNKRIAELEAACESLKHADGCWCEASFAMPGTIVSHSDECLAMQAVIAKLSGVELARAVADARGWKILQTGASYIIYVQGEIPFDSWRPGFRPDCNITQAWELGQTTHDGEWWGWSFAEVGLGEYRRVIARITLVTANSDGTHNRFEGQARFDEHTTEAETYATARCRAYLKARRGAGVCGGAGVVDSGGLSPQGHAIDIACPERRGGEG